MLDAHRDTRKMLTPHVRAIGRPPGPAQDDSVDAARVEGTPAALTSDLVKLIGRDQVLHRISDLVRYASDASPYRYVPQVVVLPRTVDDVRAILAYCVRTGRHATFRAGGTSLNGQSQSDDILIDVRRHWAGMAAEDGGARLRARPGTILNHANAILKPLGRRLGPDPASADVATIGGVIANNAGGMRCTLERNSYRTVSSLTLVLASGTVIDTAAPDAEAAFAAAEPELAQGLMELREELLADTELAQRIRHKFSIRNTNGYALSALLDADTPLGIFRRLIVGSEGTLAFMAEAVIDTKHSFLPNTAGHAAYGNLHFTLTPSLADQGDRERYAAFMSDLVTLVIDSYDGSLKAEHGTGINMAPFVRHEWGEKATDMMWRIKKLADPHGILAPNVILTHDDGINLKSFKSAPPIEDVAVHCIECGFCEAVCPSRNVTATPRQRIVLRREMARQPEGSPLLARLQDEYEYDGIETCAVDGSCAIPCPVQINTGALEKSFRRAESTPRREKTALMIARRWATAERLARTAVGAADVIQRTIGVRALTGLTAAARLVVSNDLVPSVPGPMPRAQLRKLPSTTREGAAAVYFPACINRIFGRNPGQARHPSLPQVLVEVSARAGKPLWIPGDVAGKCCSTPWSSKGYLRGHTWMAATTCDALWEWSGHGTMPVVIDAASCTNGLLDDVKNYLDAEHRARLEQITLLDAIAWCDSLFPALTVSERIERAAVHPTCSTAHLGLTKTLERLAGRLAGDVLVPVGTTCCGTAGDRGLLHPELVVSATRDEKAGLNETPAQAYLSANRTCEMGLRQATGYPYESFVFLLEELTRPT
jgi:FAD/FMN-containing dehydrogenase/Fe-S oxidoreductase